MCGGLWASASACGGSGEGLGLPGSSRSIGRHIQLNILPSLAPRGRRGWKKFYAVLKGTVLYLQKVTAWVSPLCCLLLSPKQSHTQAEVNPCPNSHMDMDRAPPESRPVGCSHLWRWCPCSGQYSQPQREPLQEEAWKRKHRFLQEDPR